MSTLQLLDRDDLRALTDCKRRAGVLDWLRARGWAFELGASGWPKVSARYAEAKLGGGKAPHATAPANGPNFDALKARA